MNSELIFRAIKCSLEKEGLVNRIRLLIFSVHEF